MERQEKEKRDLENLRLELNQEEEEQRAKERDQVNQVWRDKTPSAHQGLKFFNS